MAHRLPKQAVSALVGAVLAAVSPAKENHVEPTVYYGPVNSFDLDLIGYPGVQGRVVHGDPFGDLVGAMFFLVDGEVLWSPLPYALTSAAPLVPGGIQATDLAVMRASDGERDVLVMTTANGLAVATYDAVEGGFTVTPLPGTGPWSSATQLKRHTLPDGTLALSGLRSGGATVHVSHLDETGETPLFSLALPAPLLAHDLVDYHGDGGTDLAVVTSQGMFVFSSAGYLLRREMVDLQAGGVVTFVAQGRQRLAFWYQDLAPGRGHLRVIDGLLTEPDIALSALPPGGLTAVDILPSFAMAGDYDDDQNQDLLLQIHHCFCVLLINQSPVSGPPPPAQFSVTPGAYDAIALTAAPQAATEPGAALAYFGNVDTDPGDDLIVPLDELDRIELYTRYGLLHNGGEPELVGFKAEELVADESTYWWRDAPVVDEAHLNLALDVPGDCLPSAAQGYHYLQVATWFQDGPSKAFYPTGEQNTLHALVHDDPYQWIAVEPRKNGALLINSYWPAQDNIWVVFRFVDADVSVNPPQVLRASHFMVGSFTLRSLSNGSSIPPYLGNFSGAGDELGLNLNQYPYGSGTAPLGSAYVGAWVSQTSSALFPPGDVPQFRPLSNSTNGMGTY